MSVFEDQCHFMQSCGQTVASNNFPQYSMYWRLIDEEYQELVNSKTEVDAADAVIDLMVVLIGYGLSRGWPMEELWDEVFRSNMSKVDLATGKVKRREDGKILKPETYSPPDIRRVLAVYRSV